MENNNQKKIRSPHYKIIDYEERILAFIKKSPGAKLDEITDHIGIRRDSLRSMMRILIIREKVLREGLSDNISYSIVEEKAKLTDLFRPTKYSILGSLYERKDEVTGIKKKAKIIEEDFIYTPFKKSIKSLLL